METLTKDEVVRLLGEGIQERGEGFIYRKPTGSSNGIDDCLYVHHTPDGLEAGCGVGLALHKHGVSLHELRKHEGDNARSLLESLRTLFHTREDASELLGLFQAYQDRGWPWGKALEKALSGDIRYADAWVSVDDYDPEMHG